MKKTDAENYAEKMTKITGYTYRVRFVGQFGWHVEAWSNQAQKWVIAKGL